MPVLNIGDAAATAAMLRVAQTGSVGPLERTSNGAAESAGVSGGMILQNFSYVRIFGGRGEIGQFRIGRDFEVVCHSAFMSD